MIQFSSLIRITAALVTLAPATTTIAGTPAQDAARTSDAVAAYLRAHPGGVQVGDRDISYGGVFIVTVARGPGIGALAAADCPAGWFCFYDGPSYTYPRGRLSSCGWQDLGTWGWRNRVESAHYNMTTGTVAYLHENGATDTLLFTTGINNRYLVDAGANANRADYVSRSGC